MKSTTPCAVLLALAAASAPVAHAADPPFQAGRCVVPVTAQAVDASTDQLVSDARAVWHELSPEVREMVDELLASRGKRNSIATMARAGCDLKAPGRSVPRLSAARPLPRQAASATRPA
jgi:hypothetical protein